MGNKNFRVIVLIVIVILIVILMIAGYLYWNAAEGCSDGRGTNYYFDKRLLTQEEFNATGANFDLNEEDYNSINLYRTKYSYAIPEEKSIVAVYWQSCEIISHKILKNSSLAEVNSKEYENFIDSYEKDCNCLYEKRMGWPFNGEVTKYYISQRYT